MKLLHALVLSTAALFLSNCAGYHIGNSKPAHMEKVGKLAVPAAQNDTLEPRLSALVTNAVIKQLQLDGAYQVASKDRADAVLECRIKRINRSPYRSVRTNVLVTSELYVGLYVDYKVKESGTNTLLHSGRVYGASYIVLDPNFQLSEHQAMEEASQRIASQIVNEIAEGW
ncbi:MAG: hypothetical protein K1X78_13225 [Verrucomicrobiaceae bacterium]|nr:hypothetical protein [Verrucomicrobiaceae bacterium]